MAAKRAPRRSRGGKPAEKRAKSPRGARKKGAPPVAPTRRLPVIVGVGASAGGLAARASTPTCSPPLAITTQTALAITRTLAPNAIRS